MNSEDYTDSVAPTITQNFNQTLYSRSVSQFVINETCKAIAITLNPILCFTAQDMYEHMPFYDPRLPSINQQPWPNVEHLLSIDFLRQFTLRDKLEEIVKLSKRAKNTMLEMQRKGEIKDGYDLDAVFEVSAPDCEEALMLDLVKPELEDLFGVSNVQIGNSKEIKTYRLVTYTRKILHNFKIKDYITDKETKFNIVLKLFRSKNDLLLKSGADIICKKCVRCLKYKCLAEQSICPKCISEMDKIIKFEKEPQKAQTMINH